MAHWRNGKVVENHRWNERLCSLKVAVELPAFQAGQFVRLALRDGDDIVARAYSLVNAPSEPDAEFYFNRVPEGPLSPRLHQLQAGDAVLVSDMAAGFLVLSEVPAAKNLWMLATGTAIGPFLSILKTPEPWQRFEKVILVHGVRAPDELTYQSLTDAIEQQYPEQFMRINSVTRQVVAGALPVRINAAISNGSLEAQAANRISPADSHVMICGNPGMVASCQEVLTARGLKNHRRREPGHMTVEIYK